MQGSSRKPLFDRGLQLCGSARCKRFTAKWDVKARVDTPLAPNVDPTFEPQAKLTCDVEITCETAIIQTFDFKPSAQVTARTGTHQAMAWRFGKQTSVRVDAAHEELMNAIKKNQLPSG